MANDPQTSEAPPAPAEEVKISKEESELQAATAELDELESTVPRAHDQPVVGGPVKKSHKKLFIILAVIVLLAGLGTGAYFLFMKKDSTPATATPKAGGDVTTFKQAQTFNLDKISYAHKSANNSPYSIYYRPAAGGERKEVKTFEGEEYPATTDARSQLVAITDGIGIQLSADGGQTYNVIYTSDASENITDLKLSGDSQRIAVSVVPTSPTASSTVGGTIYSINLKGKDKKQLVTAKDQSLFVLAYNETVQKVAYAEGCYGCDGGRTAYTLYDLKTKKAQKLLAGVDVKTIVNDLRFSDDLKDAIFVQQTVDMNIKVPDDIPGYYMGAPYSVKRLNTTSGEVKNIKTIGTKQEKNTNGTYKTRSFQSGFLAGTNTPYYSEGNSIYQVENATPNLLFTTDSLVKQVFYVSTKNLVYSEEKAGNDFWLVNRDLEQKNSKIILEGDANTFIFGVTTK